MSTTRVVEPEYAYIQLRSDPGTQDPITWRLNLSRAITRFAGVHGSAIPLDLVWIGEVTKDKFSEAIVRCPAQDEEVVAAGISGVESEGYTIRMTRKSNYLPMLL